MHGRGTIFWPVQVAANSTFSFGFSRPLLFPNGVYAQLVSGTLTLGSVDLD